MKNFTPRSMLVACVLLWIAAAPACDVPECIDGPSNLTPEAVAECAAPPMGTMPAELESAGATLREDGTLVLTWSSWGLACGTSADEVLLPEDCESTGWALSAEIPAELAVAGVIELAEHPEIRGLITVTSGGDGVGGRGNDGDGPFFVGTLELVEVGEACITGVLHGFGTGDPDPTLGGPELDGSFMAPRC